MLDVLCWVNNGLLLIDQTKLPVRAEYFSCTDHRQVAQAIREMRVRGAPAIGIAAAFGYVLAAFAFTAGGQDLERHMTQAAYELLETRPTAVNLAWALEQMSRLFQTVRGENLDKVRSVLLEGALRMLKDQRDQDAMIAAHGNRIIPDGGRILTYCNTGALATAGCGTALGAIFRAHRAGKKIQVYVPETRPLLQGARLTVWELEQEGVPYTLITDNMAGYLFSLGMIDTVIVGADRIVANGDFANKIGTYTMAVLASRHHRPCYVAAPCSSFDFSLGEGMEITVEMRSPEEVRTLDGRPVTLGSAPVLNPSFDVTPHTLITGYITEAGILQPPFECIRPGDPAMRRQQQ